MSVQALSCAFAVRGLSPSEKLVLLALANFANDKMQCWPSQERLAADTELSPRTVWAALKALEDRRVVSRTGRKRADGTRSTDVFTLHFSLEVWSEPVANLANSTRNPCESQSQSLPNPVAAVARLTTFEPSLEEPALEEPIERASRAPRTPRSRLVPENWSPGVKVLTDLTEQGFTPGEIERELAIFRDHEFRDPKTDFDRTFRKWMRTSRTLAPRKDHGSHSDQRQAARQDSLIAHHTGIVAAIDRRRGSVG